MGLRRLDRTNWLSITPHYLKEHALRANLLSTRKSSVLACLPGSEAACHEVLSLISTFLLDRYPHIFTTSRSTPTPSSPPEVAIHNVLTGESFPLGSLNTAPLETAARLAMEDLNILRKDPPSEEGGNYRLVASATLFPAGWKLQDRIGHTLSALHAPVPTWAAALACPATRYLDHLSVKTATERHPMFVQTHNRLFCPDPLASDGGGGSGGGGGGDEKARGQPLTPEDIYVRRERQTFMPLRTTSPHQDAEAARMRLFTVHTYLTPLPELDAAQLDALLHIARSWSQEVAAYKGRDAWFSVVLAYRAARRVAGRT
ncbi:MAG: hypothetical protein M1818_008526 [Claussenomyces sp. TS43310]|nr:MAG: hypothetical protein M1818_008526 [Claussenomyces sp. TS43310]